MVGLGNGFYHWKFYEDSSKCLTLPVGGSIARPYLGNCDVNNLAQRLSFIEFEYQAIIFARPVGNGSPIDLSNIGPGNWTPDVGHTLFAVIGKAGNTVFDYKTYSAWPGANPSTNKTEDRSTVSQLIQQGYFTTYSNIRLAGLRKSDITANTADLISFGPSALSGCSGAYGPSTSLASNVCTCVDMSTRLWNWLTGEDMRPNAIYFSPNVVWNLLQAYPTDKANSIR
ncbi:hypothetical protein HC766_04255 [Candidatus Gracilibacteria bacterium]|nr:hypothetical protein [Candidatus Gracilibacteria bacterium]NJS41537.1 hypothetical protein [Candidatus Gracilibacteria bacterium]